MLVDTSAYLHSRWAPLRIRQMLQDDKSNLRFIVVLRDPVRMERMKRAGEPSAYVTRVTYVRYVRYVTYATYVTFVTTAFASTRSSARCGIGGRCRPRRRARPPARARRWGSAEGATPRRSK